MKLNAAQTLLAPHDADRVALVCGDVHLDYGELRDRVARTAAVFSQRGVAPGDRIAIALNDGVAWVGAFLGAIHADGVAVGINPRMPTAEWRDILERAEFRLIVADTRQDTPHDWRNRIMLRDELEHQLATVRAIDPIPLDPSAPAFWTLSSGTSGTPKAIVHAQRCVLAVERASVARLGLRPDDRLYSSSRLFFTYPLANCLLAGLKLGAALVLDPSWPTAAHVAMLVRTQRPSVLFSVPAMFRDLLREGCDLAARPDESSPCEPVSPAEQTQPAIGTMPGARFGNLRLCVSAGETLPDGLRQAWRDKTGLSIINGFGASETLTLVLVDSDGSGLRPSPGVRIRPLDEAPTAPSLPTRITIDGPTLALGYWRGAMTDIEGFGNDGYTPADLLVEPQPGRWRFAGREDSLVKVNGRWVDLVEIEEQLVSCPGLIEAAAVSVPDEDGINSVALFYVPRPHPSQAEVSEGLQAGAQALAHHQRPRWLHPIAALPRTATGRLLRRELAELHHQLAESHRRLDDSRREHHR